MHIFDSIAHAQSLAAQWIWIYNKVRSYTSIGGISPSKLLEGIQTTEILFLAVVRNERITN